MAAVHHTELWVPDFAAARPRWDWVLKRLGWIDFQDWPGGHSWRADDGCYLVIEQCSALAGAQHNRMLPGLNHLALTALSTAVVDEIASRASDHGWIQLFADRYPHAGGEGHYAVFLEDPDGYELEIVAS